MCCFSVEICGLWYVLEEPVSLFALPDKKLRKFRNSFCHYESFDLAEILIRPIMSQQWGRRTAR